MALWWSIPFICPFDILSSNFVLLPPRPIVVPCHTTLLALVPPELNAPAQVLSDDSIPSCLLDSTIDSVEFVPALLGHDFRKISG